MKEKKPYFRCAVYTRKSTDEGLEQSFNSLHAQREACEAYIKSQAGEGWNLIRTIYDDGGFSGGSMIRPAMQQLMTDVDAGLIDVVVVYKVDRLTRSLADFAKIVERFEKHGVSFVSVTQSFNTTTSMGRLTLNVLLSFAQFEREVAGERIRDKIAASRRKGMFMGGSVPTGYDVVKRKLIENPDDAETVRGIFRRYLELGSTRLLQRELKASGVVSKSARAAGIGVAASLSIGAINYLLRNRVYIGESLHKDAYYPGEHQAIVPKKLFDQVQDLIAAKRRLKFNRAKTKLAFPLTGLIFDDRGSPMAPGHSQKRGKLRYRYYVSRALIDGNKSEAGALPRVPAQAIEDLVAQYLRRTGLVESDENATESNQRIVRRVTIGAQKIWIHIDAEIVSNVYSRSHTGTASEADNQHRILQQLQVRLGLSAAVALDNDHLILTIPIRAKFRGGQNHIVSADGSTGLQLSPRPDRALVKAIVRAHDWLAILMEGPASSIEMLSQTVSQDRGYVRRVLRLAFLSPELTAAIVEGRQPDHLSLTDLLEANIPMSWSEQAQLFEL